MPISSTVFCQFIHSPDSFIISESKNSFSRTDKGERDQVEFDRRKLRDVSDDGAPGAVRASFTC